jgi:hypothetical protein
MGEEYRGACEHLVLGELLKILAEFGKKASKRHIGRSGGSKMWFQILTVVCALCGPSRLWAADADPGNQAPVQAQAQAQDQAPAQDRSAEGDNDPIKALTMDLCQSQAEGHYQLNAIGFTAHAEIICSGLTNIIATFYSKAGGTPGTMLHLDLALNGQDVIFLSYDPSPDAAKGMTGGLPMPELQLNIEALKRGQLVGEYRTILLHRPVALNIPKSGRPYPDVKMLASKDRDYLKVIGRYLIEGAAMAAFQTFVNPPVKLEIQIRKSGLQRIIVSDNYFGFALLNGMAVSDTNNFGDVFAASIGVDDTLSGKVHAIHIRGHLLNDDELEFWYDNSKTGMMGPFMAKRDTRPAVVLPTKNLAPAQINTRISSGPGNRRHTGPVNRPRQF